VKLPPGYHLIWAGEFGDLQEAKKRLEVIVPISFILIAGALYSLFNNFRDSLLALAGIPDAIVGGILALYVAHLNSPRQIIARCFTCDLFRRSKLQSLYAAGCRFVRTRCLRLEPENDRIPQGARRTGPIRADRDGYHLELEYCCRRDSRSVASRTDRGYSAN
jgi:hypothetical protein